MKESEGKKSVRKKTSNKSASRREPPGWRPWLALCVALAIVAAYLCAVRQEAVDTLTAPVEKYTIEKTGDGANADFTDKTKQIHRVVDQVLEEHQATVLDVEQADRSVNRKQVEGDIKWNARTLTVAVLEERFKAVESELEKILEKIDARILQIDPVEYRGQSAVRVEIGVRDTLAGEPVTIIADRLYVVKKQTSLLGQSSPPEQSGDKAKLALVIDDFGYSKAPIQAYAKIRAPLTYAVLPNHPYSAAAANDGAKNGREIILHLPMEAMNQQAKVEEKTVNTAMNEAEINDVVDALTEAVPHIIGVNNHQGSKATSNQRVMKIVLRNLADKGLFFIDSKTISTSPACDIAKQVGVKSAANMLFIDNQNDVPAIQDQLREAAKLALKNGQAIAIGHARVNTAAAIEAMMPEFEEMGVTLVFASSLVQ